MFLGRLLILLIFFRNFAPYERITPIGLQARGRGRPHHGAADGRDGPADGRHRLHSRPLFPGHRRHDCRPVGRIPAAGPRPPRPPQHVDILGPVAAGHLHVLFRKPDNGRGGLCRHALAVPHLHIRPDRRRGVGLRLGRQCRRPGHRRHLAESRRGPLAPHPDRGVARNDIHGRVLGLAAVDGARARRPRRDTPTPPPFNPNK